MSFIYTLYYTLNLFCKAAPVMHMIPGIGSAIQNTRIFYIYSASASLIDSAYIRLNMWADTLLEYVWI